MSSGARRRGVGVPPEGPPRPRPPQCPGQRRSYHRGMACPSLTPAPPTRMHRRGAAQPPPASERTARAVRRRGCAGPHRHLRQRCGGGHGGTSTAARPHRPTAAPTSGRPVVERRSAGGEPAATSPAVAATLRHDGTASAAGAPSAAEPADPPAAPSGGAQEHFLSVERGRGTAAAAVADWHRGWHPPPPSPRRGGGDGDGGPPPPWDGWRGVPFPVPWPLSPGHGGGGASPNGRGASDAAAQSTASGGARGGGSGGASTPRAARLGPAAAPDATAAEITAGGLPSPPPRLSFAGRAQPPPGDVDGLGRLPLLSPFPPHSSAAAAAGSGGVGPYPILSPAQTGGRFVKLPPRTPRSPGGGGGGGGGDGRAPMARPARPWSPRPTNAPAAKRRHVDGAPAGRPAMVGGGSHPADGGRSPVAGWFNRNAGAVRASVPLAAATAVPVSTAAGAARDAAPTGGAAVLLSRLCCGGAAGASPCPAAALPPATSGCDR